MRFREDPDAEVDLEKKAESDKRHIYTVKVWSAHLREYRHVVGAAQLHPPGTITPALCSELMIVRGVMHYGLAGTECEACVAMARDAIKKAT